MVATSRHRVHWPAWRQQLRRSKNSAVGAKKGSAINSVPEKVRKVARLDGRSNRGESEV